MSVQLEVYPMLGYRHPTRSGWRVLVQGRISRESEMTLGKRFLLKGLQRALRGTGDSVQTDLFYERVEGFIATPENRRRLYLEIDGTSYRLKKKSRSSGIYAGKLDLPEGAFSHAIQPGRSGFARASVGVRVVGDDSVSAVGEIFLASPSGLSIVTDIDDTIKQTNVTDRREMLAQTFLRPFESIDGMAETYSQWQSQGALFHYVSSSPWQIYGPLQQFLRDHQFPAGSMHLRWFRLRDEMFKGWRLLRRKSKGGLIVGMVKRLPARRFILVGDSGERDPEIYAKIASKFPGQIAAVLVRDLGERPIDPPRLRRLHRRMGNVPLTLFTHASEIQNVVLECNQRR